MHLMRMPDNDDDVHLIPIEHIRSKRDSVRKAREAHY